MMTVGEGADVADDWIATHISAADCCVTAHIPLAVRCLATGVRPVSPTGHGWTPDSTGTALAGRAIARHLREIDVNTGGPSPLTKAEKLRFLGALEMEVQTLLRARTRPAS
jgi:uncharacterized protein YaiI (UPF0178 family)